MILTALVGRLTAINPPTRTEKACTSAVATAMPIKTWVALKRVANARAMSWLLSPNSATKITPVLNQKASTGSSSLPGGGTDTSTGHRLAMQVEGLAHPQSGQDGGPGDRGRFGPGGSIVRRGDYSPSSIAIIDPHWGNG